MAIPNVDTITQIDELEGEETEFGIGDPRWIMRNNADLYSNRELAVAREYSTNAADAHIEADVTEPIQVTLPSSLSKFFIVRDFGYGMSKRDLQEVYTQFGDSTKRKNSKVNGMLGYGCKVAVAYTNTFTVTSIHAGIKTVAVITRRPDWSIVMKIVAQSATDERSGTEVKVPVHNAEEFSVKARDFYKFWMPGLVLVNGKEPEHYVGRKIIDGLYASQAYGNSYVVMGNVPYKIENPHALFANSKMKYFHFTAYVENGDVEFPPNREALKYTPKTKQALHDIFQNLESSVRKAAAKEIEAAKTPSEAFKVWIEWRNAVGFGLFDDLTYKGKTLQATFPVNGYKRGTSAYARGSDYVNQYSVMEMPNTVVVTEFDVDCSAGAHKKVKEFIKLKKWEGITHVLYLSGTDATVKSEWIPRDKFVTWADLKAALPKAPRGGSNPSGRPSGSWDYLDGFTMHVGQSIPTTGTLFYVTSYEFKTFKHPSHVLEAMGVKDGIVIKVPGNRLTKFRRDYPHIKSVREVAKSKVVKDGPSLLSDAAKDVLSLNPDLRRQVQKLDVTRLDDPEFKRVKAEIANEESLLKSYRDNLALAHSLDLRYYVDEHRVVHGENFIRTRYPLVTIGYQGVHEDVYVYMNAKYKVLADRKKNT